MPHRSEESRVRLEEVQGLIDLVRGFDMRRIVVLGDLVADEFVHGDIARVSREAPVLILDHQRTVVVPGGGANAVANLRALGARPLPVGLVGADAAGQQLVAELERLDIDCRGVIVAEDYATPAKSRIIAGGAHTRRQQVVRIDRGARRGELPRTAAEKLDRALREALGHADGLLVADYGYGAATPERVGLQLAEITRRSLPTTVDSRARVMDFRNVLACTPNQEELEQALGMAALQDDEAVEEAGRKLLRRTGNHAVLVTRGPRGMCLCERGSPATHVPAFGSGEVADVTGAGDTVIAAFTLALLAGAGFPDAARLANYAAGLVVMKYGTATVSQAELVRALQEEGAATAGHA
jgi:rfaE bifunctional protein kinase chain/domain